MDNKKSYVYKITCKITGEYYFGSSFNAKSDSYWGSGRRIKERILKYGKDNFVKEIIGEFDDRVEAHKVENEYIEQFRHNEKCLNQMLNSHFGSFSDESCAKNGAAKRGEKNPMYGKHLSEEHRAKLYAANRDKIISHETRAKMSAAHLGKHHTEESRAKIGAANAIAMLGKKLSEEHKARIGAAKRGKHLSEEHRARISAANRDKIISHETRAKMSAAQRGKHHTEESRAKIGAAKLGKHWRKNPVTGKREWYD